MSILRQSIFGALMLGSAPAVSEPYDIETIQGSIGSTQALVVSSDVKTNQCPDGMALRSVRFDKALYEWRLDPIFTYVQPKARVKRLAGQTDRVLMPANGNRSTHFKKPVIPSGSRPNDMDLTLNGDLLICEAFGFIEILEGRFVVEGRVGAYQLRHTVHLNDAPQEILSLEWQRLASSKKTEAGTRSQTYFGELTIRIDDDWATAVRTKDHTTLQAHLKMNSKLIVEFSAAPS